MRALVLVAALLAPVVAHGEEDSWWEAICDYGMHAGEYHWTGPHRRTKPAAKRDADEHAAKHPHHHPVAALTMKDVHDGPLIRTDR